MIDYIDLSGNWELYLDSGRNSCSGLHDISPVWEDNIFLPGTVTAAGKGELNPARETGFLTEEHIFSGTAWFRKKIELPAMTSRRVRLVLERTRMTSVWFDGKRAGSQESLIAPHIYDLTRFASEGSHELIVAVSNMGYKTGGGHLTSKDTQTNWCGITGKLRLEFFGREIIDKVRIFPDAETGFIRVTGEVLTRGCETVSCSVESLFPDDSYSCPAKDFRVRNGKFDITYQAAEHPELWSDERPFLYKLQLRAGNDYYTASFGFRSFRAEGDKFTLNGRKIFLRGKHDGLIFPLTGYAPTDTDSWMRVMNIAKSYGINHYRFHTCCPPEAAFDAADRLGIIMEPQLPFWGTLRDSDDPEYNKAEQDFLTEEGFRMLDAFGNHPSFCMMSLGNELWGSQKLLNELLRRYKEYDPRHLYTQGSNNFQWFPAVLEEDDFFVGVRLAKDRLLRGSYAMCDAPQGHVQTDKPSTMHDYDSAVMPDGSGEKLSEAGGTVQIQFGTGVKTVEATAADGAFIPKIPIVTHEIGQYETFPDLREIKKYTGALKARNFEVFKEKLDKAGLLPLAEDLFFCSGQLAVQCYKEELEAAFRSKRLAGFQMLDLQDFTGQGTALVGVLDAFMDSKGLIAPEKWRRFCNDAVLLARFERYCWESGEQFTARFELASFRSTDLRGRKANWRLSGEGYFINGTETVPAGENYFALGKIKARLPAAKKVTKLTLSLSVEGTDIENSYQITVFPKTESVELSGARIFREVNSEAEALLRQGRTVLIIPDTSDNTRYIDGTYCTDFWCYPMFRSISESMGKPEPVGTMGLLIDNEHPLLKSFTCEKWTTPQWWDIVSNSRSEILDGRAEGKRVIVRTIDNFDRCHDLALIYEYEAFGGKAVVCCCEPDKLTESPEGRAFVKSVIDYVSEQP